MLKSPFFELGSFLLPHLVALETMYGEAPKRPLRGLKLFDRRPFMLLSSPPRLPLSLPATVFITKHGTRHRPSSFMWMGFQTKLTPSLLSHSTLFPFFPPFSPVLALRCKEALRHPHKELGKSGRTPQTELVSLPPVYSWSERSSILPHRSVPSPFSFVFGAIRLSPGKEQNGGRREWGTHVLFLAAAFLRTIGNSLGKSGVLGL